MNGMKQEIISKEIAAEGAVLLRNNGVLPFHKDIRQIAWFGNSPFSSKELRTVTADAAVYILKALTERTRNEIQLLARYFTRLVLVLAMDSPIDFSAIAEIPEGILLVGSQGGTDRTVVEDLLYGRAVPSGRLSEIWRQSNPQPDYPLGFGLSYTRFNIRTDMVQQSGTKISLYLTVANIGTNSGKEVVQVYVNQTLAAFQKTPLLKPGAVYKMAVSFSVESLAEYQKEGKTWELPAGDYVIRAGNSSIDTEPEAIVRLPQKVILGKIRFRPNVNRPEDDDNELPVFTLNPQLFRGVTFPGENRFHTLPDRTWNPELQTKNEEK